MKPFLFTELDSSAMLSVMDRYREEFHNKLQENNPDLLNFEKHGLESLKALGAVDLVLIRSDEEFSLQAIQGTPKSILESLPKAESAWEQGSQEVVHKALLEFVENSENLESAIKNYMAWHEEEYTHLLYDNEIGGHDALFDYVLSLDLWFDEDGEEIEKPALAS